MVKAGSDLNNLNTVYRLVTRSIPCYRVEVNSGSLEGPNSGLSTTSAKRKAEEHTDFILFHGKDQIRFSKIRVLL